ncbi:exosortase U [Allorhodopirellula solitaria]|nr:exosortase U [Allorhodopirellula solitaria]
MDEVQSGTRAVTAERVKPQPSAAAESLPRAQSIWTWFWGGLMLACVPILMIYLSRMWRLEHYQYFPFAIGIVAWLAWKRSDRRFYPPANLISLGSLAVGGIAFLVAVGLRSPWFIAVAFFCFATGCLASMKSRHGGSLLGLALPLLLLIRLPLGYDQLLVIELQRITTVLSSLILDVVGIPHAVDHNVIQLPGRELFVAEACSGIQSVFTLAFLSTLLIAIYRRRLWLAPFYLAIALVLAVAGNVLRVTMVAIADTWWGLDWASGWSHDLLGYTTLGLSSLFLVSFDQLIVSFLHPTIKSSGVSDHNPVIRFWNWIVDDGSTVDMVDRYYKANLAETMASEPAYRTRLAQWMNRFQTKSAVVATACVAAVLLCVTTARAFSVESMGFDAGAGTFVDGIIYEPTEGLFDDISGQFELVDHQISRDNENPILGQNSDTWKYLRPDDHDQPITGQFAVSQSYGHFHELCICYQGLNWELLDRYRREIDPQAEVEVEELDPSSSQEVPVAYAIFSREGDARGYLWFASISESGKIMLPPERPGRLGSRLTDAFDSNESETDEPIMMLQLWVPSPKRLNASTTDAITKDFAKLRQQIADQINPGANQ